MDLPWASSTAVYERLQRYDEYFSGESSNYKVHRMIHYEILTASVGAFEGLEVGFLVGGVCSREKARAAKEL